MGRAEYVISIDEEALKKDTKVKVKIDVYEVSTFGGESIRMAEENAERIMN
ncbi:MAG: hypothetical protein Q9M91_05045 [Candidatus Dojkabacteria bacterium]|nr:hypothetical protein [Candidatus Dojkabacteria bacterium]MDQ7021173.1 hypothetical protein [Candidatus Dojkabacteria bacterium]